MGTEYRTAEVVNNFRGPTYIRDSVFGSVRRDTGQLEEREIAQVVGHHVAPPCQQEAEQVLGRDHLLIIEGPSGHGKRAAAITVLRKRTNEPLTALSPVTTLQELAKREYRPGHGYAVANHMDATTGPEADRRWRQVRDAVRDAGAFMVITRTSSSAELTAVTVLPWERPPLADVLRAHLGEARDNLGALLRALPPACAMSDVAAVAARVVAGATVRTALGALHAETDDAVRSWFDDGRTDRELLEITAVAFSTGVTEARLGARLATLDGTPVDLAAVADIVRTARPMVEKRQDTGAVEFREPMFRGRVLAEIRARCRKSFWDTVSAWLDDVVRQGEDLAIAHGLADLAVIDLEWVEKVCLDPWSDGGLGWHGQVTAAFTLWAMSLHEQTAPVALRVVRGWAEQGSATQRLTAALALAGELGVRYPVDAVDWVWSLLSASDSEERDQYLAAYATLFSTLTRECDDGGIVLGHLGHVLGRARGAAERDLGVRSALAVLTIADDAGEPAVSAYLRDQPDQAWLVGQVLGRLPDRGAAQRAMMSATAWLTPEEVSRVSDPVSNFEPMREPGADGPRGHTGGVPADVPAAGDDREDVSEDDTEVDPGPPYPIVSQEWVTSPGGRLRGRRARAASVPQRKTHEVLVWRVRDEHVLDSGGRVPDRVVRHADQVSVVDISKDRHVVLTFPVRSKDDHPFTVCVTFACSVRDPVKVVADGLDDAGRRLRSHVTSHRPLFDLGAKRALAEIDIVRMDISATLRALVKVRPIEMSGMSAGLVGIDVLAPAAAPRAVQAATAATTNRPKEEDVV